MGLDIILSLCAGIAIGALLHPFWTKVAVFIEFAVSKFIKKKTEEINKSAGNNEK